MQPQSQSRIKMQRHMTNIRRDARHKMLQQMRNKMYFQTQPIGKIAESFRLPPKEYGDYTILQIIEKCYKQLLQVRKVIVGMKQQQCQIGLNAHINFWAFLLQQLFTEKLQLFEDMEKFFMLFLERLSYKELAMQKLLQLKVLNTLQVALAPGKASLKFKKACLGWVAGTDGLTLINNSLINKFLPPEQYQNIYSILKQSLKFHSLQKLSQCSQIIKQIMKTADFDDTYRIYTEQSDLMVGLMSQIQRFVQDHNVDVYADAIIYLLDSYNSLIFDYARMGVALLATKMIICRRELNLLKGLQIIKFISQVQQTPVMIYLLQDRQLNNAGLWSTILGNNQVLTNQNISIKRQGYTILSNIMRNGDYNCSYILNQKLKILQQKQVIQLISYGLKIQQDITILHNILSMLSILLHYSQNFTQQDYYQENQQKTNNKNNNYFLKDFILKIMEKQIEKQIRKLVEHENTQLADNANKLCNSIQYLLSNKL